MYVGDLVAALFHHYPQFIFRDPKLPLMTNPRRSRNCYRIVLLYRITQGVPVAEMFDPRPVFYIAPLPTHYVITCHIMTFTIQAN